MKKGAVFTPVLYIAVFVLAMLTAGPAISQTGGSAGEQEGMLLERGKYLVNFGGCNDCHSPKVMTPQGPVPDETKLLSGFPEGKALPEFDLAMVGPGKWILFSDDITASVGPWGTTYAVNLTPDQATGIGLWTPEIFTAAMRTGKHMGTGQPIKPPMPWMSLKSLTDEDLRAVFAYLHSLPPVKNKVPASVAPGDMGK